MSKDKIVYLLGAGASAQALPIVKDFNVRLYLFYLYCKKSINEELAKMFASQILEILDDSLKHSTIDTVAKKYFHSLNKYSSKLNTLKRVLIGFFLYEQYFFNANVDINKQLELTNQIQAKFNLLPTEGLKILQQKKSNIDRRYDSFIAALLKPEENKLEFPENVKIITWNYDSQMELAFQQFSEGGIVEIQQNIGVYPHYTQTLDSPFWQKLRQDVFKVLHLNGIATYETRRNGTLMSALSQHIDDTLTELLRSSDFVNLTFAWEKFSTKPLLSEHQSKTIQAAIDVMQFDKKVLVIVGYSFPFFNRHIDKDLFKNPISFSKIYIQDPNADVIKDTLKNVFRINESYTSIITQNDLSQFILPPELE